MEPCTTYQNTHHQLTVVIGSQRGKTCWPFRFKLMSNIKIIQYIMSCNMHMHVYLTALLKRINGLKSMNVCCMGFWLFA